MGGACTSRYIIGSLDTVVALVMPMYYMRDAVVTDEDIANAKSSWQVIMTDISDAFHVTKTGDPNFTHFTCISWFFSCFYSRLFDVHPLCRPLFTGLKSQGKFLLSMISLLLNQFDYDDEFELVIHDLTIRHCEKGVKAIEYGIVGDVLFHSLKTCIGSDSYTLDVHVAWIKLYSRLLQAIVPVAIQYERNYGDSCEVKRLSIPATQVPIANFSSTATVSSTMTLAYNTVPCAKKS